MRIAIACDHGGIALKEPLMQFLGAMGHELSDLGCYDTNSVDYPDYAHRAAVGIVNGEWERALLLCGTGVGMSIAANRHAGVRAVVCSDVYTAQMSRNHNDANVLCLGARVVGGGLAQEILATWMGDVFEGGERHSRRVQKIELHVRGATA